MAMSIGLAKVAGYNIQHKNEQRTYRPTMQSWIEDAYTDVEKTERELKRIKQRQLEKSVNN